MKTTAYDCHGKTIHLADNNVWRRLDRICKRHTGFTSFTELVTAKHYRPTIYTRKYRALLTLANAYDAYMASIGDSRRAYRIWR